MWFPERKVYSQNGEDGVIEGLLALVGARPPGRVVELGAGTGVESNCRLLRERGYDVTQVDQNPAPGIFVARIEPHLAVGLLRDLGVERDFTLLSIDLDGIDLHVLNRILLWGYKPRIIVCEFNSQLGPIDDLCVRYAPDFKWDGTTYFGASYSAFVSVLEHYGWRVAHVESTGVNLFAVRSDLIEACRASFVKFGHKPFPAGAGPWVTSHDVLGLKETK